MKFFIDTANFEEIKTANEWGILSGVTTNPSLVAKENVSFHDRLKKLRRSCPVLSVPKSCPKMRKAW